MPETNWGRKETIIWPPHKPIYTFGAVFLAVILTGCSSIFASRSCSLRYNSSISQSI